MIAAGRLLSVGPVAQLTSGQENVTVRVAGDGLTVELGRKLCDDGVALRYEMTAEGMVIHCTRARADRLGAELVSRGVMLRQLYQVQGSLEDVFLTLVKGSEAS